MFSSFKQNWVNLDSTTEIIPLDWKRDIKQKVLFSLLKHYIYNETSQSYLRKDLKKGLYPEFIIYYSRQLLTFQLQKCSFFSLIHICLQKTFFILHRPLKNSADDWWNPKLSSYKTKVITKKVMTNTQVPNYRAVKISFSPKKLWQIPEYQTIKLQQ